MIAYEVGNSIVGTIYGHNKERREDERSVFRHSRGKSCFISQLDLKRRECNYKDTEQCKKGNDPSVVPRIHSTTELKSKEKTDHGGNK